MAKHIGGHIGPRRADQVEILCEHVIVLMRLKQEIKVNYIDKNLYLSEL